jgi:hypothetical protein
MHPGARNPKMARFSLNVTEAVNDRVERLADAAGANKGTMAALALSAGLNLLERVYMLDLEKYAEQATNDKLEQLRSDLLDVPGVVDKPSGEVKR